MQKIGEDGCRKGKKRWSDQRNEKEIKKKKRKPTYDFIGGGDGESKRSRQWSKKIERDDWKDFQIELSKQTSSTHGEPALHGLGQKSPFDK